ncbi:MAG: hypothetical protein ACYC6C_12400 [Coriobacteriia bacterium]
MAIQRRLLSENPRNQIYIESKIPDSAEQILKEFGLSIEYGDTTKLNDPLFLDKLGAVLFIQTESRLSRINDNLTAHASRLLDYDIRVFVLFSFLEDTSAEVVDFFLKSALECLDKLQLPYKKTLSLPEPPNIELLGPSLPWDDVVKRIGQFMADNPAGIAPNRSLKLVNICPLDSSEEILLRRSFSDFVELEIKQLAGGKSGAAVFSAYVSDSRWLQPYFVKIDTRDCIVSEYIHYQEDVEKYLPYHLHPRLRTHFCHLGANKGILVGDFIDKSETLLECAKSGRSGPALANLFNHSLQGWHKNATIKVISLIEYLRIPGITKIKKSRIRLAQSLGNSVKNYKEVTAIFNKLELGPLLIGQIHGDLNAMNIHVRGFDSVLIDFFACKTGPLLYDTACLEVSLLIDGFYFETDFEKEWVELVSQLYVGNQLMDCSWQCRPTSNINWFFSCVKQIRLYAREWEHGPNQYAAVLAVALLKKASKDNKAEKDEAFRRAAAYYFAERILTNIIENNGTSSEGFKREQ